MKKMMFLGLACFAMTGLSAWEEWHSNLNSNSYPGQMTPYEQQSLYMQGQALRNQEQMMSQQRGPMSGSQVPQGGTTRIGR